VHTLNSPCPRRAGLKNHVREPPLLVRRPPLSSFLSSCLSRPGPSSLQHHLFKTSPLSYEPTAAMRIPSLLTSIPRRWRTPRAILSLFIVELLLSVAALALYGIAQPDLYRTRLWKEGSNHGWNSNPNEIIYAYANYRPIPTPLPWSQFITNFNVVIAVLSLFILLVKGIMFITHVFHPLLSAVVHAVLVALYAVSIHAQTASDMSDPKHPQKGAPWYITKGCGAPVDPALHGYCQQATGTLAVTVLLWYVLYLLSLPHLESHITTPDRRVEDPKHRLG